MNELQFQRRRAHIWWLTLIMGIQYAFFAYTWLTAIRNTQRWPLGSGIRIAIPLLAIAGYWLLACAANSRISIVRPSGAKIGLCPFTIGTNRTITRPEITAVYIWNYIETNDEDLEVYNDYSIGVETRAGQYFDVDIHFKTAAEATTAAEKVANVLNTGVRAIASGPPSPSSP